MHKRGWQIDNTHLTEPGCHTVQCLNEQAFIFDSLPHGRKGKQINCEASITTWAELESTVKLISPPYTHPSVQYEIPFSEHCVRVSEPVHSKPLAQSAHRTEFLLGAGTGGLQPRLANNQKENSCNRLFSSSVGCLSMLILFLPVVPTEGLSAYMNPAISSVMCLHLQHPSSHQYPAICTKDFLRGNTSEDLP